MFAFDAGVNWHQSESWAKGDFSEKAVGDEVELHLSPDQERALLAAGWLTKKEVKK